jgi:hypothetical protein
MDKKAEEIMFKIKEYYSGYLKNENVTLYNPWSVMNHLVNLYNKCVKGLPIPEPEGYWKNSGINSVLVDFKTFNVSKKLFNCLINFACDKECELD